MARALPVDRRLDAMHPVRVMLLGGDSFSSRRGEAREPHRHDYHELIWIRSGAGHHVIDDQRVEVEPGTVTIIGRGQVHVFAEAIDVRGAVVRFSEEVLHSTAAARADPSWLVAARDHRTVAVAAADAERFLAAIELLRAETEGEPDERGLDLQHHLLSVVLLWVERSYDASRMHAPGPGDKEVQLYRRFATLLERDFARHHDASHYADALRVPAAALARALSDVTGRTTKDWVLDRVMLEASRLLRFTDLTVGQIAYELGYRDPLFFSRSFRRRRGLSPRAFRELSRGSG
jgi:AraC family transcriptional activator of pobA